MSENEDTNNSRKAFVEELKAQYNLELDTKKEIDNKANYMKGIAGTVAGLLSGFGTLLVANIHRSYAYIDYTLALLLLAIILDIFSVFLCVLTLKITTRYLYATKHFKFFKQGGYSRQVKEVSENYNYDEIEMYRDANYSEFLNNYIETYLTCNKIRLKVLMTGWDPHRSLYHLDAHQRQL